jgi:hypothetical protein
VATTKVLKVTRQMLGYPRPKGGSLKKLQLLKVKPVDRNPSVLAEKELSSSQK